MLARVFDTYALPLAGSIRAGIPLNAGGQRLRVGQDLLEQEIEMIVQETFVRAFALKARHAFDGARPFRAWLFTIARNIVIDLARERLRTPTLVPVDDGIVEQGRTPEEIAGDRQLATLVEAFAAALGEPEKSIYQMRYIDNKSARETGAAMELSEIQVRRRDAKLRDQLLSFLRQNGFLTDARVSFGRSLLPGQKSSAAPSGEGDAERSR